jgi:hypothetical protein
MLLVVLYWCEPSFMLRKEHRLRVLKRIFRPKGEELKGGWRKQHNEGASY